MQRTPSKLDGLRQVAASRRSDTGIGTGAGVPPSVLAAGLDADAGAASVDPLVGDLLQPRATSDDIVHDFDLWDGDIPPGAGAGAGAVARSSIEADVHAGGEDGEHVNVTTRRVKVSVPLTDAKGEQDQTDKISVAGSVSDVTPPPPVTGSIPPGLNPFTPEWFAQMIGAAASSAATAAATAVAQSSRSPAASPSPSLSCASAPRRLNERKVPDFWEDRPEFWFQIFDAHLSHFNPSERRCFDTLLPLLTPAARATVHAVIRTPGVTPYTRAREALLRHFGRTPRQNAREAREARAIGDRLPSEFLDHVVALLPDVRTFYEVALLDALPDNARVAALQHSDVFAMAKAADAVVMESRAADLAVRSTAASINSMSLLDSAVDSTHAALQPLQPVPSVAAVGSRPPLKKADGLCAVHARWGKEAYKCQAPRTCKMRGILARRPSPPASSSSAQPASGNGRAGGQ